MAKRPRSAKTVVPSTLSEVEKLEREIAQKLLAIETAELDAAKKIGEINGELTLVVGPLTVEAIALAKQVRAYAEARKNELTENGKYTLASLGANASVQWAKLPASVHFKSAEEVLGHLKRLKLTRFIRKTEEVNKQALLEDRDSAKKVPGLTISEGEKFYLRIVGVKRHLECALGNGRWSLVSPKKEVKE